MSYDVKVTGTSAIGTTMTTTYMISANSAIEAMKHAIDLADNEYNCKHDENLCPIAGTVYKEFEKIQSVEII